MAVTIISLTAGYSLTAYADSRTASLKELPLAVDGEDPGVTYSIAPGASRTVGPFTASKRYSLSVEGVPRYTTDFPNFVGPTASADQTALTDSTGGSVADATLAATAGVSTLTIPLTSLATGLGTSAIDLLTNYTPGYKFKVLGLSFVTTVAGTGSGASQVFNLEIGTTNLTGGVLTVTLASTDTIGKVTAATAITAANTGTSTDTLSLEMAASGTVFTAGAGYFVVTIQNMDVADNMAKTAELANALRAAAVAAGIAKGSA